MNLSTAIDRIQRSFEKMKEAFGRPVFDEIAIIKMVGSRLSLEFYNGPREAEFLDDFADDSQALRRELMADGTGDGGEFSFTREGDGAATDAYICLGVNTYLFCNHTEKSMKEISDDPSWVGAQGEFLNLSQVFTVDPLEA